MEARSESTSEAEGFRDFWEELLVSRPFLLEVFVLSNLAFLILDVYLAHSFNDFAHWAEWIPVVVSALAVGYLGAVVLRVPTRRVLLMGYGVMGLQALTGVLGLALHLAPLWTAGAVQASLWNALRYGPPVFAPLLFVDLAALATLGLWDLHAKLDLTG